MRLGVTLHRLLGHNAKVLYEYRTAPVRCGFSGLLAKLNRDGHVSNLVDTFLERTAHGAAFFG